MNGIDWSPALIERLRVLWDEGLPTVEIGRRLGVSKNAVIGKARRVHLVPRANPVGHRGTHATRSTIPRAKGETLPRLASVNGKATRMVPTFPTPTPMPEPTGNSRCQYQLWGALHADDRANIARMHADPRPGPNPRVCGARCEGSWCQRHRAIVFRSHSLVAEAA